MTVTIRTTAQFFENYNVGPDGFNTYGDGQPHWKRKGSVEFTVKADADAVMYCDNLTEILTQMVAEKSTVAERFIYDSHELIFGDPIQLSADRLVDMMNESFKQPQ
jgi:predicted acetyltransferase